MCGILGILKQRNSEYYIEDSVIKKMCSSIMHRGPDNSNYWIESGIALGHQRLSVLELSISGNQPMHSTDDRFVIIYNGEIYNHLEIRKKIEYKSNSYIKWNGSSDTETLLESFKVFGILETLTLCSGMFSIALWDKKKKILTLARDRFGEKPLYFGWVNQDFIFGSELKVFKSYPNFNNSICKNALSDYLKFNYVPSPRSIYKNIYKLEPGTFIQLDKTTTSFEKIKSKKFWSLANVVKSGMANTIIDEKYILKELESLLLTSTKAQMIADVPLGAFLSGGIDSSLIVTLMQKESIKPIQTFTVASEDLKFDESKYAREIAKHLGTDHNEIIVSDKETQKVITYLPEIYDEPFADSSQIPTYLICSLAKKKVKVALSGDGGDEIFGGYNRYTWCPRIWKKISYIPYSLRKKISVFLLNIHEGTIDKFLDKFFNRSGYKIHKISTALENCRSLEDFMINMSIQWKNQKDLILNKENFNFNSFEEKILETNLEFKDSISKMMYLDSITYLPDDILCKLDRAAMSNSLETRVPFLDKSVVDFAWRIPVNIKIKNNIGKWPLREILSKYIPSKFIDRPKAGFSIPIGNWLRGSLKDWAENLLNEKRLIKEGNFSSEIIRNVWKEHLSGKLDHSNRLWSILMFQAWFEQQ